MVNTPDASDDAANLKKYLLFTCYLSGQFINTNSYQEKDVRRSMSISLPKWIIVLSFIFGLSDAAFPRNVGTLPAISNQILRANATCDVHSINITVITAESFKGMLFAKEFSQDCRAFGNSTPSLTLSLPISGCGVSLKVFDDGDVSYAVTVVLQQDRYLRQISDKEAKILCRVRDQRFEDSNAKLKSMLKMEIGERSNRKGKMKTDWSETLKQEISSNGNGKFLSETLTMARAWMEIIPEKDSAISNTLQVGEPALLVVKSTIPAGIGWRVVDCVAHDGLGDSFQKLLDDNGCPIDELLLPALSLKPPRPIALMRHQEAVARFAAFKFPDRDRVHLSCSLQLCRNACSEIDCSNKTISYENRLARTLSQENDDILQKLEVFNSVEVKAPAIDMEEDYKHFGKNENAKPTLQFGSIAGDRTFCVSPSSMALAFCILGLILLIAVFVAAWSLLKARRTGIATPYYSRSLFSSSGGSGYGGSKLLLHESPCLNQSRNVSLYGRIS